MSHIDDLLTLKKCDCGRSYCDFFAGGVGEYGQSFSKKEVIEMLGRVSELKQHLHTLLKKPSKKVSKK